MPSTSQALPPIHCRRLAACLIDQIVIGVPALLAGFPVYSARLSGPQLLPPEVMAMPYVLATYLAIAGVYYTWMYSRFGATLGKKVLGLKLVNEDGTLPTWDAALMRYGICVCLAAMLGYGFFRILAHPDRQALHDTLVGTKVVLQNDEQ